jgi:hypothetical protein
MAAYLIDGRFTRRFNSKGISLDLQELAVGLRGGAALAAGLFSADSLKAVAVANWSAHGTTGTNFQRIFRSAGYDVFDMPRRETLAMPDCSYFRLTPNRLTNLFWRPLILILCHWYGG